MEAGILLALLVLHVCIHLIDAESAALQERVRGDDEPRMVSWRVLEGITEPFETLATEAPAWKQMKDAADQKAAGKQLQQALRIYSQLLKHKYLFGDMPLDARYDVFLSMAKLLKLMGFHQRAELLLYEAMSYTTTPREAHLQLGLTRCRRVAHSLIEQHDDTA